MNDSKTGRNLGRRILLVTRPMAPPWDEASKNFAYQLAINSPDFEFGLLTNGILENLPPHIRQHPVYTSNKNSLAQKIKLILNLKKIAADYDIIQCLFTPTKINSYLLKKLLKGKKTIQTIATLREDLFSDKEIRSLMFGDIIVTYSKYAEDKLNKLGFKNTLQIYPGIDLARYRPGEKDKSLIENLKLSAKGGENFIVTYPGEFTRLGSTDDILNMIYQYTSILVSKKIKIVFACRVKNSDDARKKAKIIETLKNNGAEDLARFPETFTTLDKMLNSSDLIIFPARDMRGKFDVPLAVIEAMACGKPVIISDLPIFGEFSNNGNSVIIKSGNTKQLAEAVLDLFQNPQKRECIGKNARIFVENNFDIQKIAEYYRKIYNNL